VAPPLGGGWQSTTTVFEGEVVITGKREASNTLL